MLIITVSLTIETHSYQEGYEPTSVVCHTAVATNNVRLSFLFGLSAYTSVSSFRVISVAFSDRSPLLVNHDGGTTTAVACAVEAPPTADGRTLQARYGPPTLAVLLYDKIYGLIGVSTVRFVILRWCQVLRPTVKTRPPPILPNEVWVL